MIASSINEEFSKLREYCERESFKGWDPYDGLNAKVLKYIPLINYSTFRLLWIQLFKFLPTNFRTILGIPKEYNPKGLALFLRGYVNLYSIFRQKEDEEKINFLKEKLLELKITGYKGDCWGYNFDWQSRAFFFPRFTPNVVASTFVGEAFLDLYQLWQDKHFLDITRSICEFIIKDLNRTYDGNGSFCFSYSPLDKSCIFNATLLASKLLTRVYSFTKEEKLKVESKKSVEFCINYQNKDGSWFYGIASNQRWIDSFHTAYNLESIYEYMTYTQDNNYEDSFNKGVDFYSKSFFTQEGIPKYYHNKIYPIDIHSSAQFFVFLVKTNLMDKHRRLLERVLIWTLNNMWDRRGYFYYQFKRFYKIKIPYIRWACAWMFYALSLLIGQGQNK